MPKYGKLTLVSLHHKTKYYVQHWLVRCDCGNTKIVSLRDMKNGKIQSCRCLAKEILRKRNFVHGERSTRMYSIWSGMRSRCTNKNTPNFKYYGGRKIKVDWKSFKDFHQDMRPSYLRHVKKYGEKETTLDRIDVNDNYSKENCRWATWNEQFKNRRSRKV